MAVLTIIFPFFDGSRVSGSHFSKDMACNTSIGCNRNFYHQNIGGVFAKRDRFQIPFPLQMNTIVIVFAFIIDLPTLVIDPNFTSGRVVGAGHKTF